MTITVKQTTENIWRLHDLGWFVVVPTNLYVKSDRKAVMGRGLALQAKTHSTDLESIYGELLLGYVRPDLGPGKEPKMEDLDETELIQADFPAKLVFFPTKLTWDYPADPRLIEKSFAALRKWLARHPGVENLAIPRVGAGNGHLDWENEVKPLMRAFLEDLEPKLLEKLAIVHPPAYLGGFQVD